MINIDDKKLAELIKSNINEMLNCRALIKTEDVIGETKGFQIQLTIVRNAEDFIGTDGHEPSECISFGQE